MSHTIAAITNEWDIFMRRYRSLFTELIKSEDIDHIFFIETPLTLYSFIRFVTGRMNKRDRERWKRVLKKGIISREGDIFVITPIVPFPFLSISFFLRINKFCLNRFQLYAINRLKKKLNVSDLILWINHPYFSAGIVNMVRKKLLCYDLCDDYNTKEKDSTSVLANLIKKDDLYLTKHADIMFVSSKKLFDDRAPLNPNVHRVPNGVHADLLRGDRDDIKEPPDLRHIRRPRLIFTGNISTTIDMELMKLINKTHPEWSVVMIGPVHGAEVGRELGELENIHLLGVKSFEESIAYMKFSDAAVIPYVVSPWAVSADSLKIYNFIASGKPVISTAIGGIENFRDLIFVGSDREDFIRKISLALNETDDKRVKREYAQYETIAGHTWKKRAERVHDLIFASMGK